VARGRVQRAVLEVVRRPAVTRLMSRFLPGLDRAVRRLTRGRITSTAQAFMPTLVLRSVGARSGLEREHTLVYARDDAGVPLLVGTNFGGDTHPAWTFNLLAYPAATIELDGRTERVTAMQVPADEMPALWPRFDAVYPGFASYRERIGDTREIRMFRLVPRG
jgi:deazaflavin-dependent oxidoreductase (nitroreductase family)